MARTEVSIELLQNPRNNHKFKYKIKDNGVSIPYIDSNNNQSRVMEKTFIDRGVEAMGHFSSTNYQHVIDAFNVDAGFDGDIIDLVFIPRSTGTNINIFTADNGYITADTDEYTSDRYIINDNDEDFPVSSTGYPYLVGIIGDFTKYTYADNTVVDIDRFCLVNYDDIYRGNGINFHYVADNMFSTGDILKSIDYDETRGEVAIGGLFDSVGGYDASNLAFFNVGLQELVHEKIENVYNHGGFQGIINCISYGRNNNLVVSGGFTDYMFTSKGHVAIINTLGGLDYGFSMDTDVDGEVYRHFLTDTGLLYIVGEFNNVNGVSRPKIARINTLSGLQRAIAFSGQFNLNIGEFDVAPSDIVVYTSTITGAGGTSNDYVVVGGAFTTYNDDDVGNVLKFNTNGDRMLSFDTSDYNIKVNRITIGDIVRKAHLVQRLDGSSAVYSPNNIYIAGQLLDETDVGAVLLDHATGNIQDKMYYNDEVNVILKTAEYVGFVSSLSGPIGKLIYGGKFTNYDNTNQVLRDNDVEVGSTIEQSLDNLLIEILDNNHNNNSFYEEVGDYVIKHTYLYYDNNVVSVTDRQEVPNYIRLTVKQFDDSGNEIHPLDSIRGIKPVLLRSDYIVKSREGTFARTEFDVSTYRGNYVIEEDFIHQLNINKNRLTDSQTNTWINLSPLISRKGLDYHAKVEDYITVNSRIKPSEQGLYGLVVKKNFSPSNVSLNEVAEVVMILDGFKEVDKSPLNIPQVLLHGDYREVTNGENLHIPYNASMVDYIVIKNNRGTVEEIIEVSEEDGYVEDIGSIDGHIMYFVYEPSKYAGSSHTIDFRGYGETTIRVRKRPDNCLTSTTNIIFINRWGVLEHTQMIGVEEKSFRTSSESYDRSIRDINGDLIDNLHSNTTTLRNAINSYRHSTGTVAEGMNSVYEDLVLSEKLWMEKDFEVLPVVIDDTTFTEKTRLIDKTIDYQFTFKEANNKVKINI